MTIQDILRSISVEFVEEGHRHARPGWIQVDCPWCGPRTQKFHLGFNIGLKYWNCWRCGGKHPEAVLIKLGLAREQAEQYSRTLDTSQAIKRERARVSLKIPARIGELQPAHCEYLLSRGFDPDEISRIWHVQGIGMHPRLGWRLYIPIRENEIQISWTTRSISLNSKQRYISASADEEAVNHKDVLYGGDYCRHSVVICEGPTDAWRIGPGACALFGTAFSAQQVNKLLRFPYRYICFDSGIEAQMKARDLAAQLSVFPGVTMNVDLDAEDPGSASAQEINALRRLAKLV